MHTKDHAIRVVLELFESGERLSRAFHESLRNATSLEGVEVASGALLAVIALQMQAGKNRVPSLTMTAEEVVGVFFCRALCLLRDSQYDLVCETMRQVRTLSEYTGSSQIIHRCTIIYITASALAVPPNSSPNFLLSLLKDIVLSEDEIEEKMEVSLLSFVLSLKEGSVKGLKIFVDSAKKLADHPIGRTSSHGRRCLCVARVLEAAVGNSEFEPISDATEEIFVIIRRLITKSSPVSSEELLNFLQILPSLSFDSYIGETEKNENPCSPPLYISLNACLHVFYAKQKPALVGRTPMSRWMSVLHGEEVAVFADVLQGVPRSVVEIVVVVAACVSLRALRRRRKVLNPQPPGEGGAREVIYEGEEEGVGCGHVYSRGAKRTLKERVAARRGNKTPNPGVPQCGVVRIGSRLARPRTGVVSR